MKLMSASRPKKASQFSTIGQERNGPTQIRTALWTVLARICDPVGNSKVTLAGAEISSRTNLTGHGGRREVAPFDFQVHRGRGNGCGAPGMPCPLCNATDDQTPPKTTKRRRRCHPASSKMMAHEEGLELTIRGPDRTAGRQDAGHTQKRRRLHHEAAEGRKEA